MKHNGKKILIGFIGQGYIGKNYADDFERRKYNIIRYAIEKPYINNKEAIKNCDIVFIAVPTPTTIKGYDASIIRKVIPLVKKNKIIVVKSTLQPGLTRNLQKEFPDYTIIHSPEFLSEATAARDAAHPFSNIVGLPSNSKSHQQAAKLIHSILPHAAFSVTVTSEEAELIKYIHNGNGFVQIVFFNLMHDLAKKMGADWKRIELAIKADPFISGHYVKPIHKNGRGAGGHCFIKDFATLSQAYDQVVGDKQGAEVMKSMERKNIQLLIKSKKDISLLKGVYGNNIKIKNI